MPEFLLNDFSGGLRWESSTRYAENESAKLFQFDHSRGALYSTNGRRLLNGENIGANAAVITHFRYHGSTQNYMVAKSGAAVWVGIGRSATVTATSKPGADRIITCGASSALANWPARGSFVLNGTHVVTYAYRDANAFKGCLCNGADIVPVVDDRCEEYDFRPLVANCYSNSTNQYLYARTAGAKEYYCQVYDRLYISDGGVGKADGVTTVRWDGFVYADGEVTSSSGSTTITHNPSRPTAFVTAGVRQGDIIFIRDDSTKTWQLGSGARTIKQVVSETQLELDGNAYSTTGKGITNANATGNYCSYVIVRVHRMGVVAFDDDTGSTPVGSVQTAGSLAGTTTYHYTFRWKNSNTGYTGNAASTKAVSKTTSTMKTIRITGINTRPNERDINALEVYRAAATGQYYKYGSDITCSSTTGLFVGTVTDNGTATLGDALGSDSAAHNRPDDDTSKYSQASGLGPMVWWNQRLYARRGGTTRHNILAMSDLNNYEYWPSYQFEISDTSDFDSTKGGEVYIGDNPGEPITAMVSEGGANVVGGRVGASLLIMTPSRSRRWYGWTWDDFALDDAFGDGSVSEKVAANARGQIFFISNRGPMVVQAGSNAPIPIYDKVWPSGVIESYSPALRRDALYYMSQWAAAYWNGWYLVAFNTSGNTINNGLAMYRLDAGTWTMATKSAYQLYVNDLCRWAGSSSSTVTNGDANQITASDAYYGRIWQMFTNSGQSETVTCWTPKSDWNINGPTYTQSTWVSKPLYFAREPGDMYKVKKINRIITCWWGANTAQNVTLYLYRDGDLSSPVWTAEKSIGALSNLYERSYVEFDPTENTARFFQIGLRGDFQESLALDWIMVNYSLCGDGSAME